jgi:integrase
VSVALVRTPHPTGEPLWLDRVVAQLRPDFAGEVILAAAGGATLTGRSCPVAECGRCAISNGLCPAHEDRWKRAGKPALSGWIPTAPARRKRGLPWRSCEVPHCLRGRYHDGLCATHHPRWTRDGKPDLVSWAATSSGAPLNSRPPCTVHGCALEQEGRSGMCQSHTRRWVRQGRPPLESILLIERATYHDDRFDLRGLPAVMRAEVAYGLQRRADLAQTQTRPDRLRPLLNRLPAGVESLRDRNADEWLDALGWQRQSSTWRQFLLDTLDYLDDLALGAGAGWDTEFGRDVWQPRRLGFPHSRAPIRFDAIEPDWLRHMTKRWARWRLSTGQTTTSVKQGVLAVRRLAQTSPTLRQGPHALTRELLERHLANVAQRIPNPESRVRQISSIAGLLRVARQYNWEPGIPLTTDIYREDYPRRDEPAPRAISETVMAQLEAHANLERFSDPQGRVLAEILMQTGLRVGDGCGLAIDCIIRDDQGAPYLRYRNHKMKRDAVVPVSSELASTIAAQQRQIQARFPKATHLLVRGMRNPRGLFQYSDHTFRRRLIRWLADCHVRDELGRPVHVTPHQWRHTYATRLINADVPQEVVRRLLDHSSHGMTARYARLSQHTIRAKWEEARKVNIRGEEISPPESALADAQWMKDNLGRVKMALPNGYCGLPLQQKCEYANACLTCPMFVTTSEFLPEHRRQLRATRELIVRGEAQGQARVVEMNRTVEENLVAIIGALNAGETSSADPSGGHSSVDPEVNHGE